MGSHDRGTIPALTENDLRLLRIFRVVAEAGGLTAAEAQLRMERSTISRHLKHLEERLGAPLCTRGPTGFSLTDFGRVALEVAVSACDTLDRVRDRLNDARNALGGTVRLGICDNCITNGEMRMLDALRAFAEAAPQVTLDLSIHSLDDLQIELGRRHLHVGISGTPMRDSRFDASGLFEEEFRIYGMSRAAYDEPFSLTHLMAGGWGLVVRDHEPRSRATLERLQPRRRASASGLEAVATLVLSGPYLGLLPTHYARALTTMYPGMKEVAGAEEFAYRSVFYALTETARPLSPAADLFVKLLLSAHDRPAAARSAPPTPHVGTLGRGDRRSASTSAAADPSANTASMSPASSPVAHTA